MTVKEPIRVLIVDDHAMVRSGLAAFLGVFRDLESVGQAKDGRDAVRQCAELQPDVVLMDLMMPEMDGVAAIRDIHRAYPRMRIIALTSFAEDELVQSALQAGATSYLLKNVSHEELAAAIRSAYAGRPTLAPEATQALIRAATHTPPVGADLTSREREVLALMVEGLGNLQLARRLGITESTAKSHVSNIISKLEVSSRTEAVAVALKQRLV